jgi:hypothetical protein
MARQLATDTKHLGQRVFSRQKSCLPLIENLHQLLGNPELERYHSLLETMCEGILTPYTTWKSDLKGFGEHVCRQLKEGKRLSREIIATIRRMADLPPEPVQMLIGQNEALVKAGNYDQFLSKGAHSKFDFYKNALINNKEFQADFAEFLREWNLDDYYDNYRLVRRTPMGERNVRPQQWYFRGKDKEELFQFALDIFSGTWDLYGIEQIDGHAVPLLQKLSINPTANGLMLFIPSYWSFDAKRDIDWAAFNRLQKARCGGRIGAKTAVIRMEYNTHLRRILAAKDEAKKLGLKGAAVFQHLRKVIKIADTTDDRTIRRWIGEAKDLL